MSSKFPRKLEGIPLEFFTKTKVAEKFLCRICNKVARSPFNIKCLDPNQKSFDHSTQGCVCENCLAPYDMRKQCPMYGHKNHTLSERLKLSKLKQNRYDKLELKCEYSKSNCPWINKLKNYEKHRLSCQYAEHLKLQSTQQQFNQQYKSQYNNNNNNNNNTKNNNSKYSQPISSYNNPQQYSHTPQPPLHKQQFNNKQYTSTPNLLNMTPSPHNNNNHNKPMISNYNNTNKINNNNNRNNNNNQVFNNVNSNQNNSSSTSDNGMGSYVFVQNEQDKQTLINNKLYILYEKLQSLQTKAENILVINKTIDTKWQLFEQQLNDITRKVNNITNKTTFIGNNNNQYRYQ